MIRLLRQLLSRRYACGGQVGPPASEAMWAELNHYDDLNLDPEDPIVQLVRQARAAGIGEAQLVYGDSELCTTCWQQTERPVYAYITDPVDALQVATYCPNCPPEQDDECD